MRFMAADQPDEFLRMHVMAVRIGGALLRHRAVVGSGYVLFGLFLRIFGKPPGRVGSDHRKLLASRRDATSLIHPASQLYDRFSPNELIRINWQLTNLDTAAAFGA
jgi:hypothetical protein